jgi:hypothetical protein
VVESAAIAIWGGWLATREIPRQVGTNSPGSMPGGERTGRGPASDLLRIGVMEVLAAMGGHKDTPHLAAVAG